MQKIKILSLYGLVLILLGSIFSPTLEAMKLVDVYDYREYEDKINTSHEKNTFVYDIGFDSSRTSFFLKFENYKVSSPDDISVEWIVDGKTYMRHLDIDNIKSDWNTTFPLVSERRDHIRLRISYATDERPSSIILVTSDQSPRGKRLTWDHSIGSVAAESGAPRIVTRAEWGADEALRYIPKWKIDAKKKEWEDRGRTPRVIEETETERARRIQADREYSDLISLDTDANTVLQLVRYEDGNKLQFPIRKSKKVNRIFLHHTAEGLDQDADDATLIRAIYLYHTKTRGWGDIGYNYLIGQRGVIYEGRAGGAYAEGAHAFGNNLGTVGVSVIGNYQELHLNRDQRRGLIEAIAYLAERYGINVKEEVIGIKACNTREVCTYKKVTTPRLAGHRDTGSTNCPGDNIYEILPEIRNEIVGKVGNVSPVYNRESLRRDPIDPEDASIFSLKTNDPSTENANSLLSVSKSLGGKKIKIRLSYPMDTLSFQSADATKGIVRIDGKIRPFGRRALGSISLSGSSDIIYTVGNAKYSGRVLSFSSDLIRIPSWSRVPAWDTTKRYNDNLFRGKLILSNQGGKLLVVNELPIEDYLKGLGEVSDSDSTEKIKTIIVAARGYAHYYTRSTDRKYKTDLYDGSDDPDSFQRYLGYGYEVRSPNVARLVQSTLGEVVTYEGKLIKPWYFSSSDGRTRSYKEYCESNNPGKICQDIPYLQSVDDPAGVGKVRNGHGVGISGVGATQGASLGKKYDEIIAYYMTGTLIRNVNTLK